MMEHEAIPSLKRDTDWYSYWRDLPASARMPSIDRLLSAVFSTVDRAEDHAKASLKQQDEKKRERSQRLARTNLERGMALYAAVVYLDGGHSWPVIVEHIEELKRTIAKFSR